MTMQILETVSALRQWRASAGVLALVPTMGNLHDGHIALCHRARKAVDARGGGAVAVSIFVNPLQFGPQEDLDNYPRTFAADCARLQAAGVDAVFHPTVAEMYPHGPQQYMVEPPALQHLHCGETRPGHFRGVATVVTKLLNMAQPNVAVFGKKDYQQLAIIRGMVADLNMPVDIIGHETERAADGLALSSRNGYLTDTERAQAPRLRRTLLEMQTAIHAGERDFARLAQSAAQQLDAHGWHTDYLRIVAQNTLLPPQDAQEPLVILAAARLGKARLIDNLEV